MTYSPVWGCAPIEYSVCGRVEDVEEGDVGDERFELLLAKHEFTGFMFDGVEGGVGPFPADLGGVLCWCARFGGC